MNDQRVFALALSRRVVKANGVAHQIRKPPLLSETSAKDSVVEPEVLPLDLGECLIVPKLVDYRAEAIVRVLIGQDDANVVQEARQEGFLMIWHILALRNHTRANGDCHEVSPQLRPLVRPERVIPGEQRAYPRGHRQVSDLVEPKVANGLLEVRDVCR